MKRSKLIKHLKDNNCEFDRHGGNHDLYVNRINRKVTAVPRHKEVKRFTAQSICKQLEIPIKDK